MSMGLGLLLLKVLLKCHIVLLLSSLQQPQAYLVSLLGLINIDLNNHRLYRWISFHSTIYIFNLSSLHMIADFLNLNLYSVVPVTNLHLNRVIPVANCQW